MSECGTCHGTGKWGVYGKACPECGLYSSTPPGNRAADWRPPLRYKDQHVRLSRGDRRAQAHADRAQATKARLLARPMVMSVNKWGR